METQAAAPDPLISLLPLFLMQIGVVICCYFIAKDKGRSPTKYVLLALIPGFGMFAFLFLVGVSNLRVEQKIDAILEALNARAA